ncbi:MAG: hypothetical protein LUQ64_01905 [Methanomicrobiales archaeon]|nr:hypothetical protein [Methanomicrobiales archaeon]
MPHAEKKKPEWLTFLRIEWIFLVILLATTFMSAFCAYQANSWSSNQSANYQEASHLRTESVRAYNDGNTAQLIDINAYIFWADAASQNDPARAEVRASRFSPELKRAFRAWIAQVQGQPPGTIPNGTPFSLPEYRVSDWDKGDLLEENATAAFTQAQYAGNISSSYVLTTLLCAITLFLSGVGEKWKEPRLRKVILAATIIFFGIAMAMVLSLPKMF